MALTDEQKNIIVEIWKKTVDVQQHFNDLALRIRNFALSAFTFIVAAVGYLLKENISISFGSFHVPGAVLMSFAGILIIIAFWFMDRHWYYNLLIGAVTHGEYIENLHKDELPELSLATQIRSSSPTVLFKKTLRSKNKFKFFYGVMVFTFILLAVLSFFKSDVVTTMQESSVRDVFVNKCCNCDSFNIDHKNYQILKDSIK